MTLADVEHVLERSFRRGELSVQTDTEDVDWSETLPNTRKLLDVDLRHWPERVSLSPTFASEIAAALDDDEEYTLTVEGAPWEIRGRLQIEENERLSWCDVSVYVPTQSDAVDWEDDVGGTRNVIQVTMRGTDPWEVKVNPAFREDLARGLQQEADDNEGEEGGAYVVIDIDDESPWRIKHGQITVEDDDGEWVLRSTPLMIAADELDWEFSFETWAEE